MHIASSCIQRNPILSCVLVQWRHLWSDVPERFQDDKLELIFDTSRDGHNMGTLYRLCDSKAPVVMVVQLVTGAVLGAYLSNPLYASLQILTHHILTHMHSLTPSLSTVPALSDARA